MFTNNLFDNLMTIHRNFDELFNKALDRPESRDVKWVPAFDCYVTEKDLKVRLFLPGVDQKDVNVSLTDNVLTINGERKMENVGKDVRVLASEVPYGKFERRITLPSELLTDSEKCAAKFENGVLEITTPIVAQYMQTRQIPIQSAAEAKQIASA